jgi:hypothetical protein
VDGVLYNLKVIDTSGTRKRPQLPLCLVLSPFSLTPFQGIDFRDSAMKYGDTLIIVFSIIYPCPYIETSAKTDFNVAVCNHRDGAHASCPAKFSLFHRTSLKRILDYFCPCIPKTDFKPYSVFLESVGAMRDEATSRKKRLGVLRIRIY